MSDLSIKLSVKSIDQAILEVDAVSEFSRGFLETEFRTLSESVSIRLIFSHK